MATTTPNLGLTIPTGAEHVSRQIINENMQKIDTAVGDIQTITGTMNETYLSAIEGAVNKCGHVVSGFFIITPNQALTDNNAVLISGLPYAYDRNIQLPMIVLSGTNIGQVGRARVTEAGTITLWYSAYSLANNIAVLIPVNYICK